MSLIKRRRNCYYVRVVIIVILSLIFVTWINVNNQLFDVADSDDVKNAGSSRTLLAQLPNCTPRAIDQFPADVFSMDQRREGAITLHILAAVYMFLGFALLCDDYFVPSLEVICEVLHLQPDVAGATFMAAGSSAPELATAIISIFIAKDDIGIGTVVGSAVFNVLFVVSVCALFANMVVNLNWWPLFRDCIFYSLSVGALAFVILDEEVYWYEAVVFLLMYGVYIVIMYFNVSLESWATRVFTCCGTHKQREHQLFDMAVRVTSNAIGSREDTNINGNNNEKKAGIIESSASAGVDMLSDDSDFEENTATTLLLSESDEKQSLGAEEAVSVFAMPTACWKMPLWALSLPLKVVFFVSIPDCRTPCWRSLYLVTFLMSLIWLSALSYLMVWMITIIGYTAGISDTIMGLTLIGFGVSLPDVIASLIVAREGQGDMAVSNAVGSNVFDILICLGLPWLIQCAVKSGEPVQVYSGGLVYATITLLGTVFILLISTHINGWQLTRKYGAFLMLVYVLFTILTCLYEMNIFGYVHPVECLSAYDR